MKEWERLRELIGPRRLALVRELMAGQRIGVPKRGVTAGEMYVAHWERLDKLPGALAARVLGVTRRYLFELRRRRKEAMK